MNEHLIADLRQIPKSWFLWSLRDKRTPIIYAGDTHISNHDWLCELQHETGGKLITTTGETPDIAIAKATILIEARWPHTIEGIDDAESDRS